MRQLNQIADASEELRAWIDAQPMTLGDRWVSGLEERKKEEAEFHNEYREGHKDEQPGATSNQRFYEAATIVRDYTDNWISRWSSNGAGTFLDYACGYGRLTLEAAKSGAKLAVGIDISETSVVNARENAQRLGLGDRTRFLQRDCEDTGLPDDAFSSAVCSGMLHHLDLSRGLPELSRIMKPGGRVLCVEALSYNPVIQLYRKRTPALRTDWEKEHILGMREVEYAKNWFRVENVRFFLMAAPLATLLPAGTIRNGALRLGHAIDSVLTRVPALKLWSWQFCFELVKK